MNKLIILEPLKAKGSIHYWHHILTKKWASLKHYFLCPFNKELAVAQFDEV